MSKRLLCHCRSETGMFFIGDVIQGNFLAFLRCLPPEKLGILRLKFDFLIRYWQILFPKIIQITLKAVHTNLYEISTIDVSYSMKTRNGNFILRSLLPSSISSNRFSASLSMKSTNQFSFLINRTLFIYVKFRLSI